MRGDRLKMLRKQLNLSQLRLAEILGVDRTMIGKYELNNNRPADDILEKMATCLNTSKTFLLGLDTEYSESSGVKIPVLGEIIAGIPIEAVQEILDYEEITPALASTGEFFALRVKGSSMEPRIYEGDVVIVKKQETAKTGDIVAVLVNGDKATVKRIKVQDNGITLIANNINEYEPHFYTNEEVKSLPVRILGRVVELRAKF